MLGHYGNTLRLTTAALTAPMSAPAAPLTAAATTTAAAPAAAAEAVPPTGARTAVVEMAAPPAEGELEIAAPASSAPSEPCGAVNVVVDEPRNLLCPITLVMFRDPVFTSAGHTYERAAILAHWESCRQRGGAAEAVVVDPLSNTRLPNAQLTPNWDIRGRQA